jgi:hypothetical protein
VSEPTDGYLEAPEFERLADRTTREGAVAPLIDNVAPSTTASTWDADKHTALVQAELARRLIWVLTGVLLGGAALLSTGKWTGLSAQSVSNFFSVAFGAVVTLTTAATSFWFGSRHARNRDGGADPG